MQPAVTFNMTPRTVALWRKMMARFRVLPIPAEIAEKTRQTGKSAQYGHPAFTEVAKGYGPCRQCLKTFRTGEESRTLFTYNPFEGLDSYPSPGPVFIHEQPCEAYASEGFPEELRRIPMVLEAYGEGRGLLAQERIRDGVVEPAIDRLLELEGVRYLHVRNLEAGCFIALIEATRNFPG
jgi:hypothetical protein